MAVKLCECNCGEPAPIAKLTNSRRGHIKGQPVRFIKGHQFKTPELRAIASAKAKHRTGRSHPRWRGGTRRHSRDGGLTYIGPKRYVRTRRQVAERKLGRKLSPDEVAYHIDGDRSNNSPENIGVTTRREHLRRINERKSRL